MCPRALVRRFLWVGILTASACVHTDPDTGKIIPRGDQRFEFEVVVRRAERLKEGMHKVDALILLGSPAERSGDGDVWVYLPERPAVLVPGRALRLEFRDGLLIEHGYRPIILGQDL